MTAVAPITVVSGLPRSGTSLMMQMLIAGGIEPLVDGVRKPDDDNPRGYLELEAVKRTATDARWLEDAQGKVVKVISQLLPDLPTHEHYRVIFMRRDLSEILTSQRRMLERRNEPWDDDDDAMKTRLAAHLETTETWLRSATHVEALFVSYNRLITQPAQQISRICAFIAADLPPHAMTQALDLTLYRNRR